MIRIFRQFRIRMLSQNRFTRYLLYAFGEIILVMIGILLALQVNNWNNQRANRKLEVKYLRSLKTDLQTDLVQLSEFMEERKLKFTNSALILTLDDPNTVQEIYEMDSILWRAFSWRQYSPSTKAADELISTGNLSLIQNDSIKIQILDILQGNEHIANLLHHMRREYDYYLYDRSSAIREMLPFMDMNQFIIDRSRTKRVNTDEVNMARLKLQYSTLLHDVAFRNGMKLAVTNNTIGSEIGARHAIRVQRLIDLITKELDGDA